MKPAPAAPRWRPLPIVAAVAAMVRLLYFAVHAHSAFFTVPVLDARHFDSFARALAEGLPTAGFATGFRGTLYPLLLSLPYRWADAAGIVVAQLAQHAAGIATAVMVAATARRIFATDRAALAAGLLYALAPVPLFFEGELLVESLFVALVALLLLVLARGATRPDARAQQWSYAAAGGLLAVATQLRPNAWILVAALPFVAPRAGRARRAAALLVALAAGSLLLALAQRPWQGDLRLLPAASGVNLYLGNRRGADGLVPRQDLAVTHGESYRDSVELFAASGFAQAQRDDPALARPSDDADESAARDRYWRARALREVAADPGGRLVLLARKASVVLWNGEVPNNRDFAFAAREETPLLAWLPARFGVVFALALCGLAVAPRSPGRDWAVACALLLAASVVLFFVADRYRLPLYVPLAMLAGGGVAALAEAGRTPRAARLVALLAAGALVTFVDWTLARHDLPGAERDLYFRSIARAETGDLAGANADARRAAALAPRDPYLHLQIAATELAQGRLDAAQAALGVAARLAPREPRVLNAAGLLFERRGDAARARALYLDALRAAPDFAPARDNLQRVERALADDQRVRRQ